LRISGEQEHASGDHGNYDISSVHGGFSFTPWSRKYATNRFAKKATAEK